MFEKLLAALPHNPSLMHQLAFYSRRMRSEESIRRTGLVFIVLAFAVQFFAVVSPPQSTVAASNNDLVNGGFTSAAQAASDCRSNLENYGTILQNYGITCDKVASAPTITIRSTDFNRQLYSMGRLPYDIAGETPVTIAGGTYYVRYLWGWDTGAYSTYQALNVTSTGGQTFLLLYNCGNLTSVGLPVPVQQPPVLSISKTTSPGYPVEGSTVAPGAVLAWRIVFNNTGGAATNVTLNDPEPANTTFNWIGSGAANTYTFNTATHSAQWTYASVPGGTINDYTDVKYQVNANTPNGTQICNVATVSATGMAPITSNTVCMTVKVNAPPPKPTPPPTCKYDNSLLASDKNCVACPTNSSIIASSSQCKSCEQALSSQDTVACVEIHKTAADLTQGITDANGTTAQPGDVIKYTLYADNTGKDAVTNYVFQEDLSDVLDYATVSDLDGGTMNTQDVVVWPALTIQPGQTASKTLTVKVDDPVPQTPTSSSDPEHFNLIMTNVYGNTVNINVPGSPAKTIETTAANLPNTGPGNSLIVGAVIIALAGFFFARARLLSREAELALDHNVNGEV